MKITLFRAENFKRLSVVEIKPDGNVVQITGKNGQGKSSVLDGIEAALAGAGAVPGKPIAKGKAAGRTIVTLGDETGDKWIVERRFTEKNQGGTLTISAPEGSRFNKPQDMLNALMGRIGFDPLAFLRLKPAEQATMLRSVVKLDVDIDALDKQRAAAFEDRTVAGRSLTSAKARFDAIIVPENLPDAVPDMAALTEKLATAAELNAEIDRTARLHHEAIDLLAAAGASLENARRAVAEGEKHYAELKASVEKNEAIAPMQPIDIAAIKEEIAAATATADAFRKREEKERAEAEVLTLTRDVDDFSAIIKSIDDGKAKALATAKMPIEGLSFADGIVTFKDVPFEQASSAEQLRVSAAIGAALNPKLRVMLCHNGNDLDSDSLKALAEFAQTADMQIFLERVEESGQVGIVMEDGHVKGQEALVEEFEKGPAEEPAQPEEAAEADKPGYAEFRAKVDANIAKLADMTDLGAIDLLHVKARNALKPWPGLLGEWNGAMLERQKVVKAMRTGPKS